MTEQKQSVMNVLFIGNSYTTKNDLPGAVAYMCEGFGQKVNVETQAEGGSTLERAAKGPAAARCKDKVWDVLVLQEQSTRPVDDPAAFKEYARALHAVALQKSYWLQTILFSTWTKKGGSLPQQERLHRSHEECAQELRVGHADVRVAPVGLAWHMALGSEVDLYADDGAHPSS
eukprot:4091541-Amphidinium_carterae.2